MKQLLDQYAGHGATLVTVCIGGLIGYLAGRPVGAAVAGAFVGAGGVALWAYVEYGTAVDVEGTEP